MRRNLEEVRGKKISDSDRDAYQIFEGQLIYNEKAYEYSGYALTPEVKYYFGWNAPFGLYFSVCKPCFLSESLKIT